MTLTPLMQAKLKKSLILHEERRKFPYFDTCIPPNITIGIGYNLSARGMSDDWIDNQYNQDVQFFYDKLNEFFWYKHLNEDRQIILIDMAFMGWQRFLEFKEMLKALEVHDYEKAAQEMLNSDWAKEVKERAIKLANAMQSGVYDV